MVKTGNPIKRRASGSKRVAWGKPGRRAAGATPGKYKTLFALWQERWIHRPFRALFGGRIFPGAALTAAAVKLAPGYPLAALTERSLPTLVI